MSLAEELGCRDLVSHGRLLAKLVVVGWGTSLVEGVLEAVDRERLVVDEASRGEQRGRCEERHLAVSDRDECRGPGSYISIDVSVLEGTDLPSHHHIHAIT